MKNKHLLFLLIGLLTFTQISFKCFAQDIGADSKFKAIAIGSNHTMVLKEDGTVTAWGGNKFGQCDIPNGLSNVKSLAAGVCLSVALKEDGTVVAWGYNDFGQCNVPDGLTKVKAISAEESHIVALKEDGTIVAWGNNKCGQCNVPDGLKNVKAISTGEGHTIALKEDGTVVAWGLNSYGQCNVPAGLSNVKAIAAGCMFSVVLKEDGTVVAWGGNYTGQCNIPAGLSNIKAIASGHTHTVALKEDGTIVTWGFWGYGSVNSSNIPDGLTNVKLIDACGNNTAVLKEDNTLFASVSRINPVDYKNIKSIAVGNGHTEALREDGTVISPWGYCDSPKGLANVKEISTSEYHTVALKEDGTVVAWCPLGDTHDGRCNVPTGLSNVKAVAAGYKHTVALKEDGTVVAWGDNSKGQCTIPKGLANVKAIAAGEEFTLALKEDGTVVAWGCNDYGQCNIPKWLTNVKAIAAGGRHSVVLKEDGTIEAWGDNRFCQCNIPPDLDYNSNNINKYKVIAIAAGFSHTVALREDGTVVAWGYEGNYSCHITRLTNVKAIAAGSNSSAAIKKDGAIVATGGEFFLIPGTNTPKYIKEKVGFLDVPANNKVVNGTSAVNGWFYDKYGVKKIEVLVDSNVVGQATYGTLRNDVMRVFPEYGTNCGFTFNLDTTLFTAGTHSIVIRETGNDGKVTLLPVKNITVNNTPARGYIDHPANNDVLGGIYNVCGWFLDNEGVSKIEVLIDNQMVGQATYGLSRPDVMKAYPLYNNSNCGFNLKLDISKYNEGIHSIVIQETSKNGVVTTLPAKSVTFSNKLPTIGCIDYPTTNQKVTDIYNIKGWLLDSNGVAKLEVVIDSVVVGEAKYGISRLDVMKVYPLYNNSNCGYIYSMDTSSLSAGTHTIKIRETSKTGAVTVLSAKTFLK